MPSKDEIEELLSYMDRQIDGLAEISIPIQQKIYDIVRAELLKFEQTDGAFVATQDLNERLIQVQKKIEAVLNVKIWRTGITDFLQTFQTIEDRNIQLQRSYNDLKVAKDLLSPARKFIYEQAKYKLTTSVRSEYVEPVKYLLMQQVTGGSSITDALKMLERWNTGELSQGKFTNNNPAPNLTKYATQIARDTAYSTDRTINAIIKERYQLTSFIYAGSIIQDSRPLCRALLSMPQPIPFEQLPALIIAYPQGLIAGTNQQNFIEVCGGYNCRHKAFPVRGNNPLL